MNLPTRDSLPMPKVEDLQLFWESLVQGEIEVHFPMLYTVVHVARPSKVAEVVAFACGVSGNKFYTPVKLRYLIRRFVARETGATIILKEI